MVDVPKGLLILQRNSIYVSVRDWYVDMDTGKGILEATGIDLFETAFNTPTARDDFDGFVGQAAEMPFNEIRGHMVAELGGSDTPVLSLFSLEQNGQRFVARDLKKVGALTRKANGVFTFEEGELLNKFHETYASSSPDLSDLVQSEPSLQPVYATFSITDDVLANPAVGNSANAGNLANYADSANAGN